MDDSALVRKIVSNVLTEAGFEVAAAGDGHEALEIVQRQTFDLALVDFVMPRLNGYQLTQAIRSIPHLRDLPIVLMSAKAEQIGERFIRQTSATDAITKPFSPEGLVAVVTHAIQKRGEPPTRPTLVREELSGPVSMPPPGTEDFESEVHTEVDDGHVKPTMPDIQGLGPLVMAQAAAAQRVSETVGHAIAPGMLAALRDGKIVSEQDVVDVVIRCLSTTELRNVAREVRTFDGDLRGNLAFEGVIPLAPLAEVLQLLRLQTQTGQLRVRRRKLEADVWFRDGRIDLASARGVSGEFMLGRYLLADALVSREDLESIARSRSRPGRWLGEQLVRSGYISPTDLDRALTRQTSEIIYETLRWPDGTYRFERGVRSPESESAALGLPVESLVLEGFRRVDEWRVIEQEVNSFDDVLARDEAIIEAVGSARLAREEQLLLDAVNGRRSVRDVVAAVSMSSFDTCKILYRLLRSRLIRKKAA